MKLIGFHMVRVTASIYGLTDPRNGAVRYVGSSLDLKSRLRTHATNSHNPLIREWMAEMSAEGVEPEAILLCEVSHGSRGVASNIVISLAAESRLIKYFSKFNDANGLPPLLNRASNPLIKRSKASALK